MRRRGNLPTQHVRHQLHAVTDPQGRQPELQHLRIAFRRIGIRHALRPTGQDDPNRLLAANHVDRRVEREDLRIHRQLAETPRDELGELRTKVENENRLMRHYLPTITASRPRGSNTGFPHGIPSTHVHGVRSRSSFARLVATELDSRRPVHGVRSTQGAPRKFDPQSRPTTVERL